MVFHPIDICLNQGFKYQPTVIRVKTIVSDFDDPRTITVLPIFLPFWYFAYVRNCQYSNTINYAETNTDFKNLKFKDFVLNIILGIWNLLFLIESVFNMFRLEQLTKLT